MLELVVGLALVGYGLALRQKCKLRLGVLQQRLDQPVSNAPMPDLAELFLSRAPPGPMGHAASDKPPIEVECHDVVVTQQKPKSPPDVEDVSV